MAYGALVYLCSVGPMNHGVWFAIDLYGCCMLPGVVAFWVMRCTNSDGSKLAYGITNMISLICACVAWSAVFWINTDNVGEDLPVLQ